MKSIADLLSDVTRRLERTWAATIARELWSAPGSFDGLDPLEDDSDAGGPQTWPHTFPLGAYSQSDLEARFAAVVDQVHAWRTWATWQDVTVRFASRLVSNSTQQIPTHVTVPTIDEAARLLDGPWTARLARGRCRGERLRDEFPGADIAWVLRTADALDDVDFDLACRAGTWFATHDATGLTPRQVPIEGLHAKWLNTRQRLVRHLAGTDDLRLAPPHPARIHFTYLDPHYRETGGRLHDSASVGDTVTLPYTPTLIVISENKDTAIHFPPTPGAISIEGAGSGAGTIAAMAWVAACPTVVYWGDMDVDGLAILDQYRSTGLSISSMLMDMDAYLTWERFGTNLDVAGKPLAGRPLRPVKHLTPAERSLYGNLTSPSWARHLRVEQERIPLTVAAAHLAALRPDPQP